jgi:hypothetical protein
MHFYPNNVTVLIRTVAFYINWHSTHKSTLNMIGMSLFYIYKANMYATEESRQLKNAIDFYHALTLLCRLIIVSNCNRPDLKPLWRLQCG